MKSAARVLSWVFGILGIIVMFYNYYSFDEIVKLLNESSSLRGFASFVESFRSSYLYISIVCSIVAIIVLVWRDIAVENGHKMACGICTLLFVSKIGGILTLLITEDELAGIPE